MIRIGLGVDVHAFEKGRPLILGGLSIDYPLGLAGHSDADVLVHAIMDALLGAAALGSIGELFPDSDPKYKDADSIVLLKEVLERVDQKGLRVQQLDCVLMAQEPKLAPYQHKIREHLAAKMGLDIDVIGLKATTTESLGFIGRKEGIMAQVVVLCQAR